MASRYSVAEKVDMVLACAEMNGNPRLAAQLYTSRHPGRPVPTATTIANVFDKFRKDGSVHRRRRLKATVVSEDFEIDVLAYVKVNPQTSSREIARQCGSSATSVWKVLRRHNLHPYHVCLHQDLSEGDFEKRLEFCNWALIKADEDRDFFHKVIWTDEAKFCNDGNVNLHNAHYWSDQNPHWLRQHNHQVRWSVNVWCGILGNRIIGPYFIQGNLTGRNYTADVLNGVVDDFASDLPLQDLRQTWFQHDGAPPHFSSHARRWLDHNFPDRWIGRAGPMFWPPRSPDLTPLDFFLWGHIKSLVYITEPRDITDLKQRIVDACASISPEIIGRAVGSMQKRFMVCVGAEGGHFEHFI